MDELDDIVWIKEEGEVPTTNQTDLIVRSPSPSTKTTIDAQSNIPVVLFDDVSRQPKDAKNEVANKNLIIDEFDLSEYEKKLHENTQQTVNLVMDLCDRTDQLKEQQKGTLLRLEEEQNEGQKVAEKMIEVEQMNEQLRMQKTKLEEKVKEFGFDEQEINSNEATNTELKQSNKHIHWENIESACISDDALSEPNGAILLPNDTIVVTDRQNGLLLFSLQGRKLKTESSTDWKWPQAIIRTCDDKILISALLRTNREQKFEEWKRYLLKFDENLRLISKIEGPKWINENTIANERLCTTSNGFIYLAVAGETFSALYELSPDAKWTELYYKRGITLNDVQVMAIIEPIVQLLVIERKRGYCWLFSVRQSQIYARSVFAIVEKPWSLCVDEKRNLFMHDFGQQKIRYIDCIVFEPTVDVALTSKSLTSISAFNGCLLAVYSDDKLIRIHRYKSYQ